MTGIFGRLLIAVLTFSIGVFLAPARLPAPAPALPPLLVEINPATAPATAESPPWEPEPVFTGTSKNGELAAVDIDLLVTGAELEISKRRFENLSQKPVRLELDPSETIDGQVIAIHPFPGDSRQFRVEQQFETSLSVNSEGPHQNLTDWKHYTSQWRELERLETNRFRTFAVTEEEMKRFPRVTREEIVKAAFRQGGKGWAEVAEDCTGPDEGPCIIGRSRVSFRISARINGRWTVIHRIDALFPMGC